MSGGEPRGDRWRGGGGNNNWRGGGGSNQRGGGGNNWRGGGGNNQRGGGNNWRGGGGNNWRGGGGNNWRGGGNRWRGGGNNWRGGGNNWRGGAVIGEGHQILKGLLPQAVEEEQESILAALREDEIERQGSILVDYVELISDQMVIRELPDLTKELKEQPEMILNCLGVAIHQVLTTDLERQAAELQGDELPVTTPLINIPHISARLYNYDPVTPLRLLRASVFGRLVCVRGTVVRVSNIRPLCARLAFRCLGCSYTQALTLQHGQFTTPTKCALQNCRSRTLVPCRSSPLTQTVDWQIIKVQELMGGEQREAGRIPRTVECHLTSDLCDSCVPGDTVTVTGIVRVTKEGLHRGNKDQCMFLLYIEATSVSNTKGLQSKVGGQGSAEAHSAEEFSLKELYAIQEIQSQPDLLRLMVQQKNTNKNSVPVRGDPHVLMVGDPGLGKSQMLQAVCNVAPRGIYVCGNSTSSTGLTVTLSRDAATGDYALEAGALVLADQGICCIDEFDKLGTSSRLSRTSVVAAANPIGGHYNRGKTVSENLKMGSALLSRTIAGRGRRGSGPHPACLLRKYISYARQYVQPTLSSEAAETLQSFYLSLRAQGRSADATPITTRQLESLIRLTEARARLELRETASKSDAEDVVEIMKHRFKLDYDLKRQCPFKLCLQLIV
ncbi:hypothetical protein WMY93_018571 [Mugilogobius chulae]|uniref:DNA helicase MCM8 n=1 Tax=Mugilogobius chulae TaxID=88201 RepID=A0AAW0NUK3_9GOBI